MGDDPHAVRAAIRAGGWDGPTAALAPGFMQANLVALPAADAFDFLRFCVANPRPCPVIEVTRARRARAADHRARRRPAHRPPALPRPRRRRGRRRAHRRPRRLARRPRRVPDRLLVHVRARAAGRRPARPPHRAGHRTSRCTRPRSPASRRALRGPAGRLDAPDDAAAGDPRDRDHQPLHELARRARPHRRPGDPRHRDTRHPAVRRPGRDPRRRGPGLLGLRRHASGRRRRQPPLADDHPRAGPHVHHRPSRRRRA